MPGLLVHVHRRVHQHDADRRLPGRGPARGHLRHRAGHGRAGPPGRRRPRRDPPPQLHQDASSSPTPPSPGWSTTPATTSRRSTRPSSWSATTTCGPSRRDAGPRAATHAPRHRHLDLRRDVRPGPVPGAGVAELRAPAAGRRPRCGRCRPTRCRSSPAPSPHGQGHETSWSMIVADKLGIDPDDVEVLHSDTAIARSGIDTYGSRSLAVGGIAIAMAADKVLDKARAIAAHQMEAAEDDLEFDGGAVHGAGLARQGRCRSAAVAFEAFTAHDLPDGMEPNLEAQVTYDPPNFSWPVRHPHLRRRGRRGDRRRRRAGVRRRRRLRQPDQPAHRRGPGARRHHPGHGPGAVRGGRLRRRRQPADVHAGRLPGARRRPTCRAHARPHRHAEPDQPARA